MLCNFIEIAFHHGCSPVILLHIFRTPFFSIRLIFQGYWQLTGQQGKEGDHFYSTLPLLPAHEHREIYLQLCIWDDYHMLLIAPLVFKVLILIVWKMFKSATLTVDMTLIDAVLSKDQKQKYTGKNLYGPVFSIFQRRGNVIIIPSNSQQCCCYLTLNKCIGVFS